MELPKLKIYKDPERHDVGYESKELSKWMKDRHFLKAWNKWSMGNTGGIIDGKFIVYFWDVRSFLNGERNWD